MVFVIVQIRNGAQILKPWYGCSVAEGSSIADLYASYSSGQLDHNLHIPDEYQDSEVVVKAGKSRSDMISVSFDCPVAEVVSSLGQYMDFVVSTKLAAQETETLPSTRPAVQDACSVLMESSRSCHTLPQKWQVLVPNRKLSLKNDMIDFLAKNRLGWSASHAQQCGKSFVNILGEVMWNFDGNHQTLYDRGHGVPALFSQFKGYNLPTKHKKRKIDEGRLKSTELLSHSSSLFVLAGNSYMKFRQWSSVREAILQLAENLRKHAAYLNRQNERVQDNNAKRVCVHTDVDDIKVLDCTAYINPKLSNCYQSLHAALFQCSEYEPILIEDYSPSDFRRRYEYNQSLIVPSKCVLYTYTGSRNHLHFVWKIPDDLTETELLQRNMTIQQELKKCLPRYHTRAMRRAFIYSFGKVTHAKPAFLREAYRCLTDDASAASSLEEAEVNSRVAQVLDAEDPDLAWDLRVRNTGRPKPYTAFLEECQLYIASAVETAVDERRHDTVDKNGQVITHLACVLSARDLHDEVSKRCPPDTPIPSLQWLRYQFWPRKVSTSTSKQYTGRLKLKHMVQSRQFRKNHVDSHYASALFRYEREFAIKYRQHSTFVCQDDKHSIKVGEPGYPVAAVERGKQVLVGLNEKMVVGDHDFTKLTLAPSVNFLVNIPESMEETFYHGRVFAGRKGSAFQSSSPIRHATELCKILETENTNPILLLYTDGGPDHRSNYPSVQIALICLFLHLDLDFLCAIRTPPYNSWKNPAERIMSLLNLALQGAGVARRATTYEDQLKSCSNTKQIRLCAEQVPGLQDAIADSLEAPKTLLYSLFRRLKLKDEPVREFHASSDCDIDAFWDVIREVDDTLTQNDTTAKLLLPKKKLQAFFDSHCKRRHYMFSVMKCTDASCLVCKPPRLPEDVFQSLHHIPDPVPKGEHYQDFSAAYGTETSEQHKPSSKGNSGSKSHGMPFSPSAQYAKNVGTVVQCSECSKWRLMYAKSALKKNQKSELEDILLEVLYVCGDTLTEVEHDDDSVLNAIHLKTNLSCNSPIEIPYYSAGNTPICFFCGSEEDFKEQTEGYPVCMTCFSGGKRPPAKRTRQFKPKD